VHTPSLRKTRAHSPFLTRSLAAPALLLTALSSSPAARGDTVHGTRSEALVERSHEVRITVHPDHAELLVRRTVYNGGPRHDQAVFMVDVPNGAVATGLRTLGTLAGRPHWFAGELMEAEAAAAKYRELTGIGGYYPKDPALLSWRDQRLLALQVFPCPPREEKSIEYTLKLPTEYRDGAYHVSLPALGTEQLTAKVSARAANARDRLTIDGVPLSRGSLVRLERDRDLDLALVTHAPPTLDARLAVAPFAEKRALVRYEIAAAPRVAAVPREARIVVAIDASRSIGSGADKAALTAADAYLSHFAAAEVEVLLFNRKIKRRHGRFVTVAAARADLAHLDLDLQNGSDVDGALLEAERLLAATPAGKARRVVLVTDGHVRSRLTPERLRAAVSSDGALVHLGLLSEGEALLTREDDHPWAAIPRRSGGLLWRAQAPGSTRDEPQQTRAVYEEWARPLRIDHLKVFSPDVALGMSSEREGPRERLDEGQGFTDTWIADREVGWLRAEGELWSRPVRATAVPDVARRKLWSSLVFGTELLHQLTEPEMMTLAMYGGAVSPVTSYLAIEPGVRPSTEGLTEGEGGGGRGEGIGLGRAGATHVSGRVVPIDRQAFLERTLRAEWRRCGGKPDSASVDIETTLAEVVDVPAVRLNGYTDALLERCLGEAAWDLALPVQFDNDWAKWSVDV
jgi:hypothetical protein